MTCARERVDRCRQSARFLVALTASVAIGCGAQPPTDRVRASGYVEATEVRVSAEVGGRLVELEVDEGSSVRAGAVIARLETVEVELALRRVRAEHRQMDAEWRLLKAGARPEEIRQAQAQVQAGEADVAAAEAELTSAERDLERYERLLASNSGSRKQRDDAATRRDVARTRVNAAQEGLRSARAVLARLQAGARPQEIEAAAARIAAVDAQIATLEKAIADATVTAPVDGVVTERLADPGEILAARTPIIVITDLDHAWANVYVGEPLVPRIQLGQAATVFTDAGGPGIPGTVTFISPRAEFTPRNVQTAEERSKLVYRLKVTVENKQGILKQGMPIEAEVPLRAAVAPTE